MQAQIDPEIFNDPIEDEDFEHFFREDEDDDLYWAPMIEDDSGDERGGIFNT